MEIPKYIENLIDTRDRLRSKLTGVDNKLNDWLQKNGIVETIRCGYDEMKVQVTSEDSPETIIKAILNKEGDDKNE